MVTQGSNFTDLFVKYIVLVHDGGGVYRTEAVQLGKPYVQQLPLFLQLFLQF